MECGSENLLFTRSDLPSSDLADSDKFRQLSECDSEHPANATAQLRDAVRVAARRCWQPGASGSTCTGRYPPEMNARGRGRKIFSTKKYSGMVFVPATEFRSRLASIVKWTPRGEREDLSPWSPLHNAGEARTEFFGRDKEHSKNILNSGRAT